MGNVVLMSNKPVNRFEVRFTIGWGLITTTNNPNEAVETAKLMPGRITVLDNEGRYHVGARLNDGVFQTLSPDMEAALR